MNTKFDIAALRDAVLWVEKEAQRPPWEREWDQECWVNVRTEDDLDDIHDTYEVQGEVCGTTYCVAGHLAFQAGLVTRDGRLDQAAVRALLGRTNEYQGWQSTGAGLLGIDYEDASALFDADNDAEAVRRIAGRIARDHGEVL